MAGDIPNPEQLTEEQLRAAYEQEIKRVRVEQVLLENVVTLVNLGMRRTGLMAGTEDERDLAQVQLAIEAVRAQMPQIDTATPQQATSIKDALSQLQMAFLRAGGGGTQPGGADATDGAPGQGDGGMSASGSGDGEPHREDGEPSRGPGEPSSGGGAPGPAQKSGRLWVPGQ